MIASLQGTVESMSADYAVINVGGVGFQVFMPTSSLSTIGASGAKVKLHTYLHVREDNLSLYGFSTPDERIIFQSLINVSGIGPKLALAILSALSVEQIVSAVAANNSSLLRTVSGVGKKMADRLILELQDKLNSQLLSITSSSDAASSEVIAALTALGYSVIEASRAIASLPVGNNLSLEDKIKKALNYFSENKT